MANSTYSPDNPFVTSLLAVLELLAWSGQYVPCVVDILANLSSVGSVRDSDNLPC